MRDLLVQVHAGETQLPDFQRGWVWPGSSIAGLIASVSLGYPAGTLMMLQQGGDVRFKTRVVEGAPDSGVVPDRLILDGQQRLTSAYQALFRNTPVETRDGRGNAARGWFYLDMEKALLADVERDEAVLFVPESRIVVDSHRRPLLDLSTPDGEYANRMFPCSVVFSSTEWMKGFLSHVSGRQAEDMDLWGRFSDTVIKRFEQYQLPVIALDKGTPRQAVCQVFERVNTGGVTLTVFELLTATFAAHDFDLRVDWEGRRARWGGHRSRILSGVSSTDFLQAVTLLASYERRRAVLEAGADESAAPRVGCRRADMLSLPLAEYLKWAPSVTEGFARATRFLHDQCVFEPRYLPYGSQLTVLSVIFTLLGAEAETDEAGRQIARWYWSGVFGEIYGGTGEAHFSRDVLEVVAWVTGRGGEPSIFQDVKFTRSRLWFLRTRNAAAYKGLYALLLKTGAVDWGDGSAMSVEGYFDNAVDIRYIFPKAWCAKKGIPSADYNSILNKTPLSARVNRLISGRPPSVYLPALARDVGVTGESVDRNVRTHLIADGELRANDFDAVMEARQEELYELVQKAMGATGCA
ncbi:DUF262 domain-containing protein [Actinosynnema pretiosum]|uniref:DUF262 domain-containing protein n=1 Tax=Actinosynnema pretiosum TaxID=42197 RepID=UPI001E36B4CB|nr:DUF262 domain-containing protein [Actinosynnema pretiosum]